MPELNLHTIFRLECFSLHSSRKWKSTKSREVSVEGEKRWFRRKNLPVLLISWERKANICMNLGESVTKLAWGGDFAATIAPQLITWTREGCVGSSTLKLMLLCQCTRQGTWRVTIIHQVNHSGYLITLFFIPRTESISRDSLFYKFWRLTE